MKERKRKCPNCGMEVIGEMCANCGYNFRLIRCDVCGKMVADTATACPNCGNKIKRKNANNSILDALCLISLVISSFLSIGGANGVAFAICLFWLIIYENSYQKKSKEPMLDCSDLKKTRNAIVIFFVINFCLGIVIL